MYRVFAFKPRHVLTTEVSVDALRASAVFSTPAPGPSGGAVADRSTHTPTNIVNIGAITELCTVLKHEANACGMQSVMAAVKQRRAGFTARCKVLLLRMARKRRRKPTFNWSLDAYDLAVCVVSPQRLHSAGCTSSAGRAERPRSAPLPPAEAPEASPAAPTSPEDQKRTIPGINSADADTRSLIKSSQTRYWTQCHVSGRGAPGAKIINILRAASLFSNIYSSLIYYAVGGEGLMEKNTSIKVRQLMQPFKRRKR